jgi:hypothetical protein
MLSSSNLSISLSSPTSVMQNEDPELWLSAHCEFLENRQKEYASLFREIGMLAEMNNDFGKMTQDQQVSLDEIEEHVIESSKQSKNANRVLDLARKFQKSSIFLRSGVYLVIGTTLGSGIGSFGLLMGIKPIIALAIGGGLGALVSGVVVAKND